MKVEGTMVEAKENSRKVLKPIMEKKRRERINGQLEQLKALVCKGKDKLEKADILELTVVHLKSLMQPRPQPTGEDGYKAGYSRCAQEFADYISTCHDLPTEARARILSNFGRTFGGGAGCVRSVAPAPVALPAAVIILPAAAAQCERPTVAMPYVNEYGRLAATPPSTVAAAEAAATGIKMGSPAEQSMWRPW